MSTSVDSIPVKGPIARFMSLGWQGVLGKHNQQNTLDAQPKENLEAKMPYDIEHEKRKPQMLSNAEFSTMLDKEGIPGVSGLI